MNAPANHNASHVLIPSDDESVSVNSRNNSDSEEDNEEEEAPDEQGRRVVIRDFVPKSSSSRGRRRNDLTEPVAGNSGRSGREIEQDAAARPENPGLLIAPYNVVLRITEPDSDYQETKATMTLHEIFSEYHAESRDINADAILESVLETVRAENPSIGRDTDIILIECTADVRQRKLVDDIATHCFPQQEPRYTVASKLAQALEYYYTIWVNRIPRQEGERRAWVADIEDRFCTWQLTPVAQSQSNEKIENLRLAIQFVKKWMAEPEPGVTEQMIPGHLKLIQKGWNELKEAKMPTEQAKQAAQAQQAAFSTDVPEFKYPREYFQTLPTDKVRRLEYVQRIRENYNQWKNTLVAQQFRKNVLLAFEKLMQHTTEWLGYTNTDKAITESTLKMFFGLLKERWNEFLDKTEKYSPLLAKRSRPEDEYVSGPSKKAKAAVGDDCNSDDGDGAIVGVSAAHASAPSKNAKATVVHDCNSYDGYDGDGSMVVETAVAVVSTMLDAKPAAKGDSTKLPVEKLEWKALDDGEYSQVSLPFDKLIDPNPLRSDSTKGLFGAVEQNDLAKVQHFFAQGAASNLRDEFGETPLHRAAAIGNKAILDHLRLWGADPSVENSAGELPIHVAAWHGHPNAVRFFLRQLRASSLSSLKDSRGRTPLHHACQQGHVAVARVLVESFRHELVIEMLDKDRLSPRHYALMGGNDEMVQYLDGLGAKRDGTFDPTSLFDACSTGRLGLVQWIVESTYADLSANDKQGRTPRDCAQQGGHTDVVKWIDACLAV